MSNRRRRRICILFGGRSGEHEVSRTSAASVISALDPDQFELSAMGITGEGCLADIAELRRMIPQELHARVQMRVALEGGSARFRVIPKGRHPGHGKFQPPEVYFPLLHGPYGEDGTIQGLLEMAGVPYIGCGVLASAAGMDKDAMKRLFQQAGLPLLPYRVIPAKDAGARGKSLRRALELEYGYPMFSKPANLGSSVGVCKIHSDREFESALRLSAQYDRKVIVEKGIEARELECAVLGNEDARASAVGEIIPGREFYDYEAKYSDPASRLQIPAAIPADKTETIKKIAVEAFHCVDGSGLARVDFLMDRRSGDVWLNEINTMPGFTPISMYPKLWAACGLSFNELVARLVQLALQRFEERSAFRIR